MWCAVAFIAAVIPRESGKSNMPRLLGSITAASGILDRPVKPDDDSGGYIRNNACRSIFPVPVFGNSSIKITSRGYLYGKSLPLT